MVCNLAVVLLFGCSLFFDIDDLVFACCFTTMQSLPIKPKKCRFASGGCWVIHKLDTFRIRQSTEKSVRKWALSPGEPIRNSGRLGEEKTGISQVGFLGYPLLAGCSRETKMTPPTNGGRVQPYKRRHTGVAQN